MIKKISTILAVVAALGLAAPLAMAKPVHKNARIHRNVHVKRHGTVRRAPADRYIIGRRYHGHIWYGRHRHRWHGRWYDYGVGPCWINIGGLWFWNTLLCPP